MAHDVIKELKNWVGYFYVNGEWIENPKVKSNGRDVNKDVVKFLNDLFHLLIEGTLINNCTVIWLNSNASSVKSAIEHYNNTVDEKHTINFNTANSKIRYDKIKLEGYYTASNIINIINYPEKYLKDANDKLFTLKRKYMKDTEYSNSMVIKIPKDKLSTEISSGEWNTLVNLIDTYSKRRINMINYGEDKVLTDDMIGYYNYLISSNTLNELEQSRLNNIRTLLGLGTQ